MQPDLFPNLSHLEGETAAQTASVHPESVPLNLGQVQVYKSNAFIVARLDWTALMHRIVGMMVAQLSRNQEDFREQRVYVSDVQELIGTRRRSLHEECRQAASQLLTQKVEFERPDGGYSGYNLLSDAHYVPGEACIVARFNPNMKPFLLKLAERYTKYRLEQIMRLSSPYSIRFYEIVAMNEWRGSFTMTIQDLRSMFKMEDKYPRYRDFKRRVIEQAQKELTRKCDLTFEVEEIRKGRMVVALRFRVLRKERAVAEKRRGVPPRKHRQRLVEETADALPFDLYWASLTPEERGELEQEARQRALSADPSLSERVLEAQVYYQMQVIWKERAQAA